MPDPEPIPAWLIWLPGFEDYMRDTDGSNAYMVFTDLVFLESIRQDFLSAGVKAVVVPVLQR